MGNRERKKTLWPQLPSVDTEDRPFISPQYPVLEQTGPSFQRSWIHHEGCGRGVTAMPQSRAGQAVDMDTGSQVGLCIESWSEPGPSAG